MLGGLSFAGPWLRASRGWSAAAGLLALLLLVVPATPVRAQTVITATTTTTGAINNGTPCTNPLVRTINVAASFTVADVDLGVLASHAWRGDIRITLQSPAGTRVQLVNGGTNNQADNFNVRLSDENAGVVGGSAHTANDQTTPAPPPYQRDLAPNNPLSAFDGENSAGNWRLEICDTFPTADNGTFLRADLFLTSPPPSFADLSLAKTVSNAAPASGTAVTYTLTVTNAAASNLAATGVQVRDILPPGLAFTGATGTGTYDPVTGVWDVGNVPVNAARSIAITATIMVGNGRTVLNEAEIIASGAIDSDSAPNNGLISEDDYASVTLTTTGARAAGTPPALTCPAGTSILDWNTQSWTSGSLTGTANVAGIGAIGFTVASQGTFSAPLALTGDNTGGLGTAGLSLFQSIEYANPAQVTTTTIALPAPVPGVQFTVFDVDFAANDFADRLTVTGSLGGAPVTPVLTNGVANYVAGNVAIGDAGSAGTSADGNVIATFAQPVDSITIVYGNHSTAPPDPDGQAISLHDFTFCTPVADLSVSKTSVIYNSGGNPLYHVPGNDVTYAITISNNGGGSVTGNSVFIVDTLPPQVTFFNGDANGPAAGTDPVLFANSGSGLTFTYGTDVRFATGSTAPASFAACSYTPAAGYDPAARFICFNPKGTMAARTTTVLPGFSLSFRARIE